MMTVSALGLVAIWIVIALALTIIIRQHMAYFRRTRALSFGAFMETGGWLILLLASIAAAFGGLRDPGTRVVEIAAALVGVLFLAVGSAIR